MFIIICCIISLLFFLKKKIFLIDINECSLDKDGCEQDCNNNIGSYTCSCIPGYQLSNDGLHCAG